MVYALAYAIKHLVSILSPLGIVGFITALFVLLPSSAVAGASPSSTSSPAWDINQDGTVDISDILLVSQHLGEKITEPPDPNPDVNGDGEVDILDLILVGRHFGENYDEFSIYVEDLLTGHRIPDATVKLYSGDNDVPVSSGQTNSEGSVTLYFSADSPYIVEVEAASSYSRIRASIDEIKPGQSLSFQMIPELGSSRYGSTLEDLKRITHNDGYHEDTILEKWGSFPIPVNVLDYTYTYLGVDMDFNEIFWRVAARLENEVKRRLPGKQVQLFEAAQVNGYGIDVNFVPDPTWAQFRQWDSSNSNSPEHAELHIRKYSTADDSGVARTENLEKEIENALVWLLLDGDGDASEDDFWERQVHFFRTETDDLSNMDIVDDVQPGVYNLMALMYRLDNGTDLEPYKPTSNRHPTIFLEDTGDNLRPLEPVTVEASNSSDLDGDSLKYHWEQIQGFGQCTISDPDSALTIITAQYSGDYVFRATVSDQNGGVDTKNLHLYFLADCPQPEPIETEGDRIVAAYYVLDWGHENWWTPWNNGRRSQDHTLGRPRYHSFLGNYSSSDSTILDWHIKMAVENGVNTLIFESGRPPQDSHQMRNFEQGFLQSTYIDQISFFMHFNMSHAYNRKIDMSIDEAVDEMVPYYTANLFNHPSYLHIDGKPVLMLYHAHSIFDVAGMEGLEKTVLRIRDKAKSNGYPEIYLIADFNSYGRDDATDAEIISLFDGISWYALINAGTGWERIGNTVYIDTDFSVMIEGYIEQFEYMNELCHELGVDFHPSVLPGSDNSIMFEIGKDDVLWRHRNSTPEKFAGLLRESKRFMEKANQMLIIYAWNEHHEGGVLEPSHELGFGNLEQIREVFGVRPTGGWKKNITP